MASRRSRERANSRPWEQEPATYSRDWFRDRVDETNDRIEREWSDSMKANSVYAAATLPVPTERCPNTGDMFDEDDDEQYHPEPR